MPGLFQTLNIGRSALLTSQASLQTIGHNIANVNTPGYSRQRVTISTKHPETNSIGSFGTGVSLTDVRHVRDLFLGQQYREESKSLGEWIYKESVYGQIENVFNEPGSIVDDDGLSNNLSGNISKFWNSWDNFSKPDSLKSDLVSSTKTMLNSFHELYNQIDSLRTSIDSDLSNYIGNINSMTEEIARLNHQIQSIEVGGSRANDLRDNRDTILDELSMVVDVNTHENKNGEMVVYIGSMSVVNGRDALRIESKVENIKGKPTHKLVWEGTDVKITNTAGQLKALIESRDVIIPRYLDKLDSIAKTIVEEVNKIHMQGATSDNLNAQTGIPFFDPTKTSASNIAINPDILADASLIVKGKSGSSGDGQLASDIFNLQFENVMNKDSSSINDFYNSIIGTVAVESREAKSFASNYDLLVQQIDFNKQSVQGVSLDEEMINMIKYQHAYDAAARVITSMDQALDTVLSMGVVGR